MTNQNNTNSGDAINVDRLIAQWSELIGEGFFSRESIDRGLIETEQEIVSILSKIKKCQSVQEADVYFDLLDQLQLILAQLIFKYRVSMSMKMRKFVHDFDRLDDIVMREHIFSLVKESEYV